MDVLKKKAIRLYNNNQRITSTILAEYLSISYSDAQELLLWVRLQSAKNWWYLRNFGITKKELMAGKPPSPYIHKQCWKDESRKPRIGGYEKEIPWSLL